MATVATYFRRSEFIAAESTVEHLEHAEADQYRMRNLPGDNIYLFSKRIDNSRLVREADPGTRTDCWSAIATVTLLAVMLGTAATPRIGGILSGIQAEKLKTDQQELLTRRRMLEIQEARILSQSNLDQFAAKRSLVTPVPGQEQHLQPHDSALAMNVPSSAGAQ
jgi:hypothetical protein